MHAMLEGCPLTRPNAVPAAPQMLTTPKGGKYIWEADPSTAPGLVSAKQDWTQSSGSSEQTRRGVLGGRTGAGPQMEHFFTPAHFCPGPDRPYQTCLTAEGQPASQRNQWAEAES